MTKAIVFIFLILSAGSAQIVREKVRLEPAIEAWMNGSFGASIGLLNEKTASDTANAVDHFNLGYLYYLEGDPGRALEQMNRSREMNPEFAYPYLVTSWIYRDSGNDLGALNQLRQGVKINPQTYELNLEFARILESTGRTDRAVEVYNDVIEEFPDESAPRIELARILRKRQEPEAALALLTDEKAVYPDSEVLIERAQINREMGNNDRAIEDLVKLCRDYPKNRRFKAYRDTLKQAYQYDREIDIPPPAEYNYRMKPGEALDYKVSYSMFNLGWLNVRTEDPTVIDGKRVYPVTFFVNSNPDYGFLIELHHVYESYIDPVTLNAIRLRGFTPTDKLYLIQTYHFNYDSNEFISYVVFQDGRYHMVRKALPRTAQGGVSMLYYARGLVSNKTGGTTTVVIDENFKYGHITYLDEREDMEVVERDLNTIKIFARAEFKGVAGMNGDAWGWFSPDDQHVPVVGKLSIILGSITLSVDEDSEHMRKLFK